MVWRVSRPFENREVVVVGASSGVGRGVARRLIDVGASVLTAARRVDLLDELVTEAGGGRAFQCDLLQEDAGTRLADAIRQSSGRLDALFVSAGSAPLRKLVDTSVDEWRIAMETNVIGINRLLAATLPLLHRESIVIIVSSETATLPRSYLGAYGASKAALEHSIRQWSEEHPWLRLTAVSLGATVPTDFGQQFEPAVIVEALQAWSARGRNQEAFMDMDEVCDLLVGVMATLLQAPSVGLPRLELRSPSPVAETLTFLDDIRGP
jgi:NAD(P)-dependent dehydrogenase (short-subunit alcohol dehydrogenase family)